MLSYRQGNQCCAVVDETYGHDDLDGQVRHMINEHLDAMLEHR